MHGRAAFEGIRRICGAYSKSHPHYLRIVARHSSHLRSIVPRDDFMSRYRVTNYSYETIIGRNLNLRSRSSPRDQAEEAAITRAP